MNRRTPAIVLTALALLLGGCASSAPTSHAEAPAALFAPSYWRLTELMGQPVAAPSAGSRVPSIRFEREGGRVSGFSGCNSFSGGFTHAQGNRLRFSQMAATLMACADANVEPAFFRVLDSTDSYHVDGDVLVLHRARMAPLARFEAVTE